MAKMLSLLDGVIGENETITDGEIWGTELDKNLLPNSFECKKHENNCYALSSITKYSRKTVGFVYFLSSATDS